MESHKCFAKDGFCNNCFPNLSFFTIFGLLPDHELHIPERPPTPSRSVPFQELPAKPSESDEVWDGGPIG